jgi:guanylate kinase
VPSSAEPALLVLIGPGGVGKGTLARRLVELDGRLWLSRSWTTRTRRPAEAVDAYEFVDRERFEKRIAADGFVEWAEFLGNLYGTPTPTPPEGADVLLEIDLEGARQVLARHPDARVVLIVPPSEAHQIERLQRRGDTEAHVQARVERGRDEIAAGRTVAHHVVVNDDVEASAAELLSILAGLREARVARASDEAP